MSRRSPDGPIARSPDRRRIAPARLAAYNILRAVSSGRADLPTAIAHARRALQDDRDRALAADISAGVQRWRAALDYLIVHFARRTLEKLDPEVVDILRLSIYQLLHLTRVPAAAVVDDAVDLAKRAGKRSAGGFVNGVLRNVSRQRGKLPLPPRPERSPDAQAHSIENREATVDYLSITLSHPRWLVERWLSRFGFDATEAWLRFNNAPAPLTLRANRFRMNRDELQRHLEAQDVETEACVYAPDGVRVVRGRPLSTPNEGVFVVQDEASQLVTLLAGDAPGPRVLDTCASPGGKATAIAASLAADGRLVACDVRDRRIELLRNTIAATGARGILVVQADLLQSLPFRQRFDCVIVDAPCSGLGTLRRDPDIRWRRREEDLPQLEGAQRRMLDHAAEAVAPGGRLIYATCSSEPEENELVADAFLGGHPAFRHVSAAGVHRALPPAVLDAAGDLRTQPDRHGLEAFYGRVMGRRL